MDNVPRLTTHSDHQVLENIAVTSLDNRTWPVSRFVGIQLYREFGFSWPLRRVVILLDDDLHGLPFMRS
jgi:hypothetical protein